MPACKDVVIGYSRSGRSSGASLYGQPMNFRLKTFFARLIGGEEREKATPKDWRLEGSIFFLVPVFLWLFAHLGRHFLDNAGVAMIWLYSVTAGIILLLATAFCVKVVPTKVLFILAAIAWAALIWAVGWHKYF